MKIALVQMNPTVGDFDGNRAKILAGAERAQQAGASVAVFPELALIGYPPLDLLERAAFIERAAREEAEIIDALPPDLLTIFGNVARRPRPPVVGRALINTAVAATKGKLLLRASKTLLPTYDVFDEARHFESGKSPAENIVEFAGHRIGVSICEDIWNDDQLWSSADMWRDKSPGRYRLYAKDPINELADAGANVIVNLSASPWAREKRPVRHKLVSHAAKRHGVWIGFTNMVGANDGLIFDGTSMAFSPEGRLLARGASWEEDFVVFDTNDATEVSDAIPDEVASVHDALVLGVRDYFRKTGFERAIVGLSGGIDSAVTAYLAAQALGGKNVTGISMPSHYSSEHSKDDARVLAENLGMQFHTVAIAESFHELRGSLDEAFAGLPHDIAEENLQARIRGNILMAFSNKFGGLVLATGNKSEAAMGYCTLYGDTNGALAVLADLYKNQVYSIARYANRNGPVIPVSSIDKPPSAELRPNQKDEDSLPPYDLLDRMLELFIEFRQTAEEIAAQTDASVELARDIITKVYRNEFKRRQLPPTLRVSRKAWTGRYYPIVQKFIE